MRVLTLVFLVQLFGTAVATPRDTSHYTGFAVALAWPKVWAKEAGDGYDKLMRGLGFNDGGFYRVGHAALILINAADSSCHYLDFGRYHAPVGYGRVRSAKTDHQLAIGTKASFEAGRLNNLNEILCEVQSNKATHAFGPLYASYVRVNFNSAFAEAESMQNSGVIPYGPFEKEGSNCSRFVRQIILAGEPNWAHALRLEVVPMITPTTLYPVSALYHWTKVPGCIDLAEENSRRNLSALPDSIFKNVLPEPNRPEVVPAAAQWLSGEVVGSWFMLEKKQNEYLLKRYASNGDLECQTLMRSEDGSVPILEDHLIVTYPSNCASVVLVTSNGDQLKLVATTPQNRK